VNLDTGQSVFLTSNVTPPPGVYLNTATQTIVVVSTEPITGQTQIMTGSASAIPTAGNYLQTGSGLALNMIATVPPGDYVNLDTGQSVFLTSNVTPPPGVYLNTATQTIVVVTTEPITGQTQIITGSASTIPTAGNYLQTASGPTLNVVATVPPGDYVNMDTGQRVFLTPNTMPEPGVYFNEATQTIIVVTVDPTTGELQIKSGSSTMAQMSIGGAQVKKPAACK